MSITISNENIFDLDVEAIVNPVNCVGVMGKGLALEFKNRYPDNFKYYKQACFQKTIQIGKCLIYRVHGHIYPYYIINFPTKKHWSDSSKYYYIEEGLKDLKNILQTHKISSIAIPALGCGLGGLNVKIVYDMLVESLIKVSSQIYISLPKGV